MQEQLVCYKTLPLWIKDTLPEGFKAQHNTQQGTWAKLSILKGSLNFALLTETGEVIEQNCFSVTEQPPFVEPQQWHKIVDCSDDMECQLAFYCLPEDYSQKKYDLTKTHSEVLAATKLIQPCKTLDLGCGRGRNSLYLSLLGFDMTAVDENAIAVQTLAEIASQEQLTIKTATYNINEAALSEQYGFIVSTVVMMFLEPERIPLIIKNMQDHTLADGYNLIVAAMSTEDCPCPLPFSFTFKEDELKNYYQGWNIIKYNENMGELHKKDEQGNYMKMRFATLLAQKATN